MTLIIDGHNLIPQIYGVALSDPDDEDKLIRIIQEYCRVKRTSAEVFFDGALSGFAGQKKLGRVRVHYVRREITADEAIMAHLKQLGKQARNVRVVSSDRQVQRAAKAVHASVISSGSFSSEWQAILERTPDIDPRNQPLTEEELDSWEKLFQGRQSLSQDEE